MNVWQLQPARDAILRGGVIAYPTETVYGLGCDPFNDAAIERLLTVKRRAWTKGLIVISDTLDRLLPLIRLRNDACMDTILNTWPGPVTWLFPATLRVPALLRGRHTTLAVRVTSHPTARELCRLCRMPIVSTSANLSRQQPLHSTLQVRRAFTRQLDYIVAGTTGPAQRPSEIRDAYTGQILRSA